MRMRTLKIVEELEDIDRRLIEWLRRDDLTREQRDALVVARKAVVEISSQMLVARVLDPADVAKLSETSAKILRESITAHE